MINTLDVARRYANEWLVLDARQMVVDHGPDLGELSRKYTGSSARLTFYFASDSRV